MTHTKDEALKLALEALNTTESDCGSRAWEREQEAITAIKQALSAPVQEPVAWLREDWTGGHMNYGLAYKTDFDAFPVYTAPPAAQPAHVQKEDLYDLAVKADNWGQP
jgi:hypothetical protein